MGKAANHKATDENRKLIESLSAFGISHEDIARKLTISHDTLTRHYPDELKNGLTNANAAIANSLYRKAKDGDTACMIFWLKTRARWRETGDDKEAAAQVKQSSGVIVVPDSITADSWSISAQSQQIALESKKRELAAVYGIGY